MTAATPPIGPERAGSPPPPDARRWLALAVLCLPLLIVSLDNTVLNVALPTLVRRLHASDSELQWIVDAYVLVFGGLLLASGSLADRLGRKRTFCAGLATFAACSVWAACSGSSSMLIAARASMGVGAALIMPATVSIITNTFTDPGQRQRALGIWAATTGAGVALGPIVGGVLLAHFSWGSVFLINVPIAAAGLALALPFVPNSLDPNAARPDPAGALVSIAGLGLLLWAIIQAPLNGWTSAPVIAAGATGLALLVGFLALEAHSTHPMLKLELFHNRSFSVAIAAGSLLMFALVGSLFVLTQFLQFQLGYSPLQAGVRMLPAAGGILLVAPFSPVLVRKLGTKLTVAGGLLLVAGGLWQISGSSVTTTYLDQLPGTIMLGLGTGCVLPACIGALMATVPPQHTGIGSATNSTFMQVGSALGVAILGSLLSTRYQHLMTSALAGRREPAEIERAILGSLGGALGVAERAGGVTGTLLAGAARAAFINGMDLGLHAAAGVALIGAAIALLALPSRAGTAKTRRPSRSCPHADQTPASSRHTSHGIGLARRSMHDRLPRAGAAVVAGALLAIVMCDLTLSGTRTWWDQHALTGSILSSILVVGVTAGILDVVVERRRQHQRAVTVAVQAAILYTQAVRTSESIIGGQRNNDIGSDDALDHLRTLGVMLLTASPTLFEDPQARPFLEQLQRVTGSMYRTGTSPPDDPWSNREVKLLSGGMAQLRADAEPILARLPNDYRSILTTTPLRRYPPTAAIDLLDGRVAQPTIKPQPMPTVAAAGTWAQAHTEGRPHGLHLPTLPPR